MHTVVMAKKPKARNAQAVAAWDRKGGPHNVGARRPTPWPDPDMVCEGCGEPEDYCECHFDDLDEVLFGEV